MSDNLNEILKNIDQNKLRALANSKAGRDLASRLTASDKKKLINEINKLDPKQVKQKLNEINGNNSQRFNTEDIISILKKL